MTQFSNDAAPEQPPRGGGPPQRVPVAIGWAVVVAVGGGLACGWIVGNTPLGDFGWISLWGLGVLGGVVSRKITVEPSRPIAWCLVAACAAAMLLAEVYVIRARFVAANGSWAQAVQLLPTFISEYMISAAMAALFTAFGAQSAFQRAGRRFRYVMVVEQ